MGKVSLYRIQTTSRLLLLICQSNPNTCSQGSLRTSEAKATSIRETYTRELVTAIAAFRCCATLLDVKNPGVAARCLDDACAVGGGGVSASPPESAAKRPYR